MPRFRNVKDKETNGFIRGYGYQGGSAPDFNIGAPGFGAAYKNAVRERDTGPSISRPGANASPRKENYVEIDKDRVDAWGIPILKVHAD